MIDALSWLHISDFHFVAEGDDFSQRVAAQALFDDVAARIRPGLDPSFVVVTGDIAQSGQPAQYEVAREFLIELASKLELPHDRFFFVPGNHDVDRERQTLAFVGACQSLTSQAAVDRVLGQPDNIGALIERQFAYRNFTDSFTVGQARQPTDDGLGYVATLDIDGFTVCIVGLNSAWLSGQDGEEMRLLIGERQMINALILAEGTGAQLQVALAHHPISWLQEWDQLSCHQRVLPQVDFFHRGHLHHAEISLASLPTRPCLMVAAGSGHATRFYDNSYNLMELDLGAGGCVVRPFRFDPAAGRYEAAPEVTSPIHLRGVLPGGLAELADAMAGCAEAAPYAGYLAALLIGHQAEVPVVVDGHIEFLVSDVASEFAPAEAFAATASFLSLRNLLRLYDARVPLVERVNDHAATVDAFGRHLADLATSDEACRQHLMVRAESGVRVARESGPSHRPHATEYLLELQRAGDFETLEPQARRQIDSRDPLLALLARRLLVEALMRSDEGPKRAESFELAQALLGAADVAAQDFILASAASEVLGNDPAAVRWTREALTKWPTHEALGEFARRLALRTGDVELRAQIEATKDHGNE